MDALVQARIYSAKKIELEDAVPLRTPFSAHIDICSVCNYKCSFCFQSDKEGMREQRKHGVVWGRMKFDVFKKIVDDIAQFEDKVKKLKIGNHGEPTLHPQLPDMIAYIRDSGIAETIELFTNGSKLNPKLNQQLVDAGLQRINISVEGVNSEAYKRVAGVKNDMDKFIGNIRDLFGRREQLKMYIKVVDHAVALDEEGDPTIDLTEEDKKYFYDTFGGICDEIFIENVVPQWAETKQNALGKVGMYGQKVKGYKSICPFPFMYLHFNSDGSVAGCTLDWPRKVLIGDAKKERVVDIWRGEKLKELRVKMLEGKRKEIPFCDTCDAPMVCCNENLDPHSERLLEKILS
jgi:MoaA/NifB/PqqE/SkfB family radical SAM enzyme